MTAPASRPRNRIQQAFDEFVRAESAGGIVLLVGAIIALVWANMSWDSYHHFWETEYAVGGGGRRFALPLHAWINDALMAVFFFVVGLEIKRELLVGELASVRKASLPIVGALGGMVVPALIFWTLTRGTPQVAGWGIPMATDIAFALGVVTLLGRAVPPGLKVFLAALAIVDDMGAVLVIAVFYTAKIDGSALAAAGGLMLLLFALNRLRVRQTWIYLLLGVLLWIAVFRSGLHSTIAGVLLALTIPATADADGRSMLSRLEQALHGVVAFAIMPIFALANAGVKFEGNFAAIATQPVVVAVTLGLLIGKPLGIAGFSWLAVRAGIAQLPSATAWRQLAGVAAIGGIGFTMSLFVAGLAYGEGPDLTQARIGILGGSLLSGILGWLVFRTVRSPDSSP